jgi:hypothetical protein
MYRRGEPKPQAVPDGRAGDIKDRAGGAGSPSPRFFVSAENKGVTGSRAVSVVIKGVAGAFWQDFRTEFVTVAFKEFIEGRPNRRQRWTGQCREARLCDAKHVIEYHIS